MLRLRHATRPEWTHKILANLDAFLQDHAANERKAAGSALRLASHYPGRHVLVDAMIGLAGEEIDHFRRVYDVLHARNQPLGIDHPDPYMTALERLVRKKDETEYLLDRLVVFSVVEARGCERFDLLAAALDPGPLRQLYEHLTRAEARHNALFGRLARTYFDEATVERRLDTVLDAEAEIARQLPLRATLH
jgi:tRNA-(ms[2]io[6]A)-hydroxylase